MNRAHLSQQLISDEGMKLKPYRCTAGKLTIGVGRNLDDVGISEAEAKTLLSHDIDRVQNEIRHQPIYRQLDSVRQTVLCNMAFNLGTPGLLGFKKMWAALEEGDYTKASVEMLDSQWARQVKGRATRLAEQMRTGRF